MYFLPLYLIFFLNFSHAIHLYIIILYMSYMSCQDSLHIIFTTCHPRMIYMSFFYIPSYYHPRINCMLSFACHLRIDYMLFLTCHPKIDYISFQHVIQGQFTCFPKIGFIYTLFHMYMHIYIYIYSFFYQMPNMLVVN